jgi:O-antigen ligase
LAGVLLAFAFWKRHVRVVAAIGIVITLLVLVEPRLVDRLAGLSLESGTGPTRLVLLRAGIDDFLASPIWGRGIGTFEHYYGYLDPQSHQRILGRSYHNGYIQIAADTGIVGLIALFVALILIGRQALRLRRSTSPWIRTIGCAFILTSLGVLIYSASSNLLMRPKSATYYWLLGGMVLAAHRLEARHRRLTAISHDET